MARKNRLKRKMVMQGCCPGESLYPVVIRYVDGDGQDIFPRWSKFYRAGTTVKVPSPSNDPQGREPDQPLVQLKVERQPTMVMVTYTKPRRKARWSD